MRHWCTLSVLFSMLFSACDDVSTEGVEQTLESQAWSGWDDLGRHLFYDRRLSIHDNRSCGICHEQAKGFTDGFVRAVGSTEEIHPRNTLTLINVSNRTSLGWITVEPEHLEAQMLTPLLGTTPVEMGLDELLSTRLDALNEDRVYQRLIAALNLRRLTLEELTFAIASFQRQITSYKSPYDHYLAGQNEALSASAQRGLTLFSDVLNCHQCHGGRDFDQPNERILPDAESDLEVPRHGWFNTGLYNLGDGRYPQGREGLFEITGEHDDIGKYRVPTLRNLAFTGPYYHDGTGASLDDVLRDYNEGGRVTRSGPYIGDGRRHPNKHPLIKTLGLTADELADLKAFLLSLTDEYIVRDPRLSDPWERAP